MMGVVFDTHDIAKLTAIDGRPARRPEYLR
jgi:hypothetical protein